MKVFNNIGDFTKNWINTALNRYFKFIYVFDFRNKSYPCKKRWDANIQKNSFARSNGG